MYKMSITSKIISLLLFLFIVSCTTKSDTTTMAIVYNLNDKNFIFCLNDSYYLPFFDSLNFLYCQEFFHLSISKARSHIWG